MLIPDIKKKEFISGNSSPDKCHLHIKYIAIAERGQI